MLLNQRRGGRRRRRHRGYSGEGALNNLDIVQYEYTVLYFALYSDTTYLSHAAKSTKRKKKKKRAYRIQRERLLCISDYLIKSYL